MAITAQMVKELRQMTGAGMMDCKKALVDTDGNIDEAVKILREKGLAKAAKKAGRIAAEGISTFVTTDDAKKAVILEVNSETDFVAKNEDFKSFVNRLAKFIVANQFESVEALKAADFESTGETVEVAFNGLIAKIGENLSIRRFDYLTVDQGQIVGYIHGNGKISVIVALETSSDDNTVQVLGKDLAMQIAAMNPKFVSQDDIDQTYIENEREILMQQALNEGKPQNIVEKMVEGRLKKEMKEVCLLEQVFVKDSDISCGQLVENISKDVSADISVKAFKRYEVGEGIEKKEEDFAAEVAATMANK